MTSQPSGLHPVTSGLLAAVDAYVARTAAVPLRIPEWVFDGGVGPDEDPELEAYVRSTVTVARGLFDDTLAVALWHDFWTLADRVGCLVERCNGGTALHRSDTGRREHEVVVRPTIVGLRPPHEVADAALDDALAAAVLCRASDVDVRREAVAGRPGSKENLTLLFAAAWLWAMLEHRIMTVVHVG